MRALDCGTHLARILDVGRRRVPKSDDDEEHGFMKATILILAGALATSTAPAWSAQEPQNPPPNPPMQGTKDLAATNVMGKVESYTANKSITVVKADGTSVTLTIPEGNRVPTDVAVGKQVSIRTRPNGTTVETITVLKTEK